MLYLSRCWKIDLFQQRLNFIPTGGLIPFDRYLLGRFVRLNICHAFDFTVLPSGLVLVQWLQLIAGTLTVLVFI